MNSDLANDPNGSPGASSSDEHDDIIYPSAIPFVLAHMACVAAFWTGITTEAVVICLGLYWLRIFAIGAGYHRYFSHRAYRTSRAFQFVLAILSQSTAQKSVLWWAAKHRHHHLHSDTEQDVHSPRQKGFWYSHVGWIFVRRHDATDLVKVADFACYPELMWLHRLELAPPVLLALLCFALEGWAGLVVGFFWSTALVYHATFCINSLAHVRGRKRYVTGDDSRNNWLLAIFTMGEGLAQQPPRLPEQRAAGVPMVGNRCNLLSPESTVDAAHRGPAQRAASRRARRVCGPQCESVGWGVWQGPDRCPGYRHAPTTDQSLRRSRAQGDRPVQLRRA